MGGKKKKGANKKADNENPEGATQVTAKAEGRSKTRCQVDIFNDVAMENAYFTCHNIQDVLMCRGFPWPDAQKKKKKGKKR